MLVLSLFLLVSPLLVVGEPTIEQYHWQLTKPVGYTPKARHSHTQVSSGDDLTYIFGGTDGHEYFNDLFSYNIEEDRVTKLYPLQEGQYGPSPRAGACMNVWPRITQKDPNTNQTIVARNRTLVLFGGKSEHCGNGELWFFNTGTLVWYKPPSYLQPSPRAFLTCVTYGTHGAEEFNIFGGTDGSEYFGADDFMTYNSVTDTWFPQLERGVHGPSGRAFVQGVNQGDTLVVYGGYNGETCNNETWEYSFSKSEWRELVEYTHAPPPNAGYAGVEMFGGGYDMFGGLPDCDLPGSDLYATSNSIKDWDEVPDNGDVHPHARAESGMSRHGHTLIVYGGADGRLMDGEFKASKVYNDWWLFEV